MDHTAAMGLMVHMGIMAKKVKKYCLKKQEHVYQNNIGI